MNRLKFIIIFLVILISYTSKGDQVTTNLQDSKYLYPLSPQASDFMKYGNTPITHFIGESNVKIPVYTYNDKLFDIPIYLGYNSAGFIPNKREGIVGLNWFLNAGGMITRKVNGWPDEREGTPSSWPTKLHGLYYGIKNNLAVKTTSKSNIFNFNVGSFMPTEYWHIDGCEVEPDEFSVNAPGCNGEFYIENNGIVRFKGNPNYKVDLANFNTQPSSGPEINDSEIIITTDSGYKYYFGGTIQNLEVSYTLQSPAETDESSSPMIIGWHITKIVAPNGKQVKYYYKTFAEGLYFKIAEDKVHYLLSIHDVDLSSGQSTCNDFGSGYCNYVGGSGGQQPVYELTKTVYLEKIEIDKTTIEFSYLERANKFYQDIITSDFNQKTLELKYIYIKYNNVTQKSFTLNYDYRGGTTSRYFLSSFVEAGAAPYTFAYYKQSEIPNPKTHGIDYWGFWNGGGFSAYLIPATTYNQDGDFTYTGNEREPNESKCDVALLQQITYPTGGYTQFIYEGHRYSQRLERRIANKFLPVLYSVSGLAGGARIKEIKDNDGAGTEIKKEYKYFKNYPDVSTSSGILLEWPRYFMAWKYDDGYTHEINFKKQSFSFNSTHNSGEKYIQYSEVTEVMSPSNGYTVYKFKSYESNPDINDYGSKPYDPTFLTHIDNVDLYNNYVGIKMNDCSFQRGYPYEITTYSATGTRLHKKEVTLFTTLADYPDNYLVSVYGTGGLAASCKIFFVPFLPKTEIETSFVNGSPVAITTNYLYDQNNMVKEITKNNSDGGLTKTAYRYTTDCMAYSPYNAMYSNNILDKVIEETTLQDGKVTSSVLTPYKIVGSNFVPSDVFRLETTTPITSYTYFNGLSKDSHYNNLAEIIYQDYDVWGNVLKFVKKDGITSYFVWGYDKKYPVVRIDSPTNNLDLTYIRGIIDAHSFTNDPLIEVPYLKTQLNSFINNSSNFVNLYTFKPLTGITSETAANRTTSYYYYDSVGRLSEKKNDDSKLLKRYKYRYATN